MGTHRTGYGATLCVGHSPEMATGLPVGQCNEYNCAAYGVFPVDLNFLSALAKHFDWAVGRNHAPTLAL